MKRTMTTTTTKQLFAILSFVSAIGLAVSSNGPCEQSILSGRYILSCRGKNLKEVPVLNVNETVYDELTLAQNQITRLESSAFSGVRTKRLDLSDNPLVFISPEAFQNLDNNLVLLMLTFSSSLSEFPVDGFSLIPNLLTLEVAGHGFRKLFRGAFSSFLRLENLSFTKGLLTSLSSDLFQSVMGTLSMLDLSDNDLTSVPTESVSLLSSLRSLNLAGNNITSLGNRCFGDLKLEVLKLSTQKFSMSAIDDDAFRGLASTLRNLSMASLSLTTRHLRALKQLTGLIDLDLSLNKINHLGDLFNSLTSIVKVNLQNNPITALSGDVFRYGASIRVLNLAFNDITSMDPDSFTGLTSLEHLDLGNSRGLVLDENTFRAQRSTLKYLILQDSNLLKSQWTAIEKLTELKDLFLGGCDLISIPDFVFQRMTKLRSIDLKNNRIDSLSQNSLTGLENSLEILNLLGNRIQTLDSCIFHGFTKINLFQLSLQQNPLLCDCGLQWLYTWFINVTRNESYEKRRISWTCAFPENTLFRALEDSNFSTCDQSPSTPLCYELTTVASSNTEPALVEVGVEIASLKVVNATSETLTPTWEIITNGSSVAGFSLTCEPVSGGDRMYVRLEATLRTFHLKGLAPSVTYRVCLEVVEANAAAVCVNATTSFAGLSLALIYGISVGGGVSLFVLLLIIVCCCCCVTPTSRHKEHVIKVDEPKLGNNTKRFQKPQQGSVPDLHMSRSIADQLESLTDEERYRLINLLTHSGGSVASLDYCQRSLPRQRLPPGYITPSAGGNVSLSLSYDHRYVPEPEWTKHEYDYIPEDEFYDEISMDEIV